jgi:hypothetical protein
LNPFSLPFTLLIFVMLENHFSADNKLPALLCKRAFSALGAIFYFD